MSMLLLMAAVVSATMFVSCGNDEDDPTPEKDKPQEKVQQGSYNIHFPILSFAYWPDNDAEQAINDSYEQYKKNVFSTLQIENDKMLNWSDIVAQESKIREAYAKIANFEYTVKACKNANNAATISFKAVEDEFIDPKTIYFDDKKAVCKLDMPENTTCQFYIEIASNELAVPSLKEFNTGVKDKFVEALKEIFTDAYSTQSNTWAVRYYNLANFSGDRKELINRVKDICSKVEVPEAPANLKEDLLNNTTLASLMTIKIEAFDPNATAPRTISTADDVFTLKVSAR